MASRRPRFVLADLMLVIGLVGLIAGFLRWFGQLIRGEASFGMFVLIELATVAWCVLWVVHRQKRDARPCEGCGRPWAGSKKKGERHLCAPCRLRSRTPAQIRKENTRNLWTLFISLAITSGCLAYFGSRTLAPWLPGQPSGIVLVLVAFALVALGFVLVFVAILIPLVILARARLRRLEDEDRCLDLARKCAGQDGATARMDPILFWASEPVDPVPMLQQQAQAVRETFARIVGDPVALTRPLRVLAFARRRDLVAFHHQTTTDLWNLDGLYTPASEARIASLHTERLAHRLNQPENTARSVLAYAWMEAFRGSLPASWLQQGVSNAVVHADDLEARTHLNRKMLAAIGRGTTLPPERFFLARPKHLFRLVRAWYDPARFAEFLQFNAQSWSVVEYLAGAGAPPARRDPFRTILRESLPQALDGATFERAFGYDFDSLLRDWRAWVESQGIGAFTAPPEPIREALSSRILPLITDPSAPVLNRIAAIRDVGRVGYAFGADTIIALLRHEQGIPHEEPIWALQSISGRAWGDDPDRWDAWWAQLPAPAKGQAPDLG